MQTKTQKKVRIVAFMKDFIDNAQYKIVKGGQLGLSERSLANYKNFQKIISCYEANVKSHLHFHSLNASVIEHFKRWLLEEQHYSLNHAGRLMGFLKTVCKTAANYNIDIGRSTHLIAGFSRPQQDQCINTISFKEYGRIVALKCPTVRLRNAQKWLILGFWLGQRVSDLLRLDPSRKKWWGVYRHCTTENQKTGHHWGHRSGAFKNSEGRLSQENRRPLF